MLKGVSEIFTLLKRFIKIARFALLKGILDRTKRDKEDRSVIELKLLCCLNTAQKMVY
jgi:hypothetical protein